MKSRHLAAVLAGMQSVACSADAPAGHSALAQAHASSTAATGANELGGEECAGATCTRAVAPDALAFRGYFAHPPYAVEPYASNAPTWDDLERALGAAELETT